MQYDFTCTVEDCDEPPERHGLCDPHWIAEDRHRAEAAWELQEGR